MTLARFTCFAQVKAVLLALSRNHPLGLSHLSLNGEESENILTSHRFRYDYLPRQDISSSLFRGN